MSFDSALSTIWISFTILMFVVVLPIFVWAVKTGQFGDQERAAHLALMIEENGSNREKQKALATDDTDEHG